MNLKHQGIIFLNNFIFSFVKENETIIKRRNKMYKINKPIAFSLVLTFSFFSVIPAEAGYYKTIYVNEPVPATTVIVNQPVQERVIVQEKYVETPVISNEAATVLGVGALVGGIIWGVTAHKHYKKMDKKHQHNHVKIQHNKPKSRHKPNRHH